MIHICKTSDVRNHPMYLTRINQRPALRWKPVTFFKGMLPLLITSRSSARIVGSIIQTCETKFPVRMVRNDSFCLVQRRTASNERMTMPNFKAADFINHAVRDFIISTMYVKAITLLPLHRNTLPLVPISRVLSLASLLCRPSHTQYIRHVQR